LAKSNPGIKRKESTYLLVICFLTGQNLFVFCMGTIVAGIPLNDEKFGMLYGNHINMVGCEEKGL